MADDRPIPRRSCLRHTPRQQPVQPGRLGMRRRDLLALAAGVTTLRPLAGRAQQKAMPVIGMLSSTARDTALRDVEFSQGLREAGYVEGQNVAIDYRSAEMTYDRLPALAADLVARNVDLIVTSGPPAALAAKGATSTI